MIGLVRFAGSEQHGPSIQEQAIATLNRGLEASGGPGWLAESLSAALTTLSESSGLGWLRREIEDAMEEPIGERQAAAVRRIVSYEDPGPGGFYDDAGHEKRQPRLVSNWNASEASKLDGELDPMNRPSANTLLSSESEPIVFRYSRLDPNADYLLRVTLVIPSRSEEHGAQTVVRQNILADGATLAENLEVPVFTAEQFEFDVPRYATRDGEMELSFEPKNHVCAIVSEIWVMRK